MTKIKCHLCGSNTYHLWIDEETGIEVKAVCAECSALMLQDLYGRMVGGTHLEVAKEEKGE